MSAEWSIGVALLLIPTFVLVITVMQIPGRKSLSQSASAAAARAYVQVSDQNQAVTAARAAAAEVIIDDFPNASDAKRDEMRNDLNLHGKHAGISVEVISSTPYCPGQEVEVRVVIPVPLVLIPFQSSGTRGQLMGVSSSSIERIDDYSELDTSDVNADINDETKCSF